MSLRTFRQHGLTAVLIVLTASATAAAQGRRGAGRAYDPNAETTVRGTVESVTTGATAGCTGRNGTHAMLNTENGSVEVCLGPSQYLSEHKLTLAKGDKVEVVGARVVNGSTSVIVAREVMRGTDKWTLRDAQGRPLWRGGARRGRGPAAGA